MLERREMRIELFVLFESNPQHLPPELRWNLVPPYLVGPPLLVQAKSALLDDLTNPLDIPGRAGYRNWFVLAFLYPLLFPLANLLPQR